MRCAADSLDTYVGDKQEGSGGGLQVTEPCDCSDAHSNRVMRRLLTPKHTPTCRLFGPIFKHFHMFTHANLRFVVVYAGRLNM